MSCNTKQINYMVNKLLEKITCIVGILCFGIIMLMLFIYTEIFALGLFDVHIFELFSIKQGIFVLTLELLILFAYLVALIFISNKYCTYLSTKHLPMKKHLFLNTLFTLFILFFLSLIKYIS